MNWLGELVGPHIKPTDFVLDVGCGILLPTGKLCAVHIGLDIFPDYLEKISGEVPTMLGQAPQSLALFVDGSYDVVLLLDVLEHMTYAEAMQSIVMAQRIARRKVLAFTPEGHIPQDGWDAWDMPHNPHQEHKCGLVVEDLEAAGFEVTRHPNVSDQAGPHTGLFGVWTR